MGDSYCNCQSRLKIQAGLRGIWLPLGMIDSRIFQLCRTQQSSNLLYLQCLRKFRSVFTKRLKG